MAWTGGGLGIQPRGARLSPEAPPSPSPLPSDPLPLPSTPPPHPASLSPGVHSEARIRSLRTLGRFHFDPCRLLRRGLDA